MSHVTLTIPIWCVCHPNADICYEQCAKYEDFSFIRSTEMKDPNSKDPKCKTRGDLKSFGSDNIVGNVIFRYTAYDFLFTFHTNCVSILYVIVFGPPFVKRFALCHQTVVCLSCLSVCDIGVLWPNGWITMPLGME